MRKSYRVNCAFYGGERMENLAGQMCNALSRYGSLLDFNRKKLRKQRYHFDPQDLLLIVVDEKLLENPGEPEAFTNIRGRKTPCIILVTAPEESMAVLDQKLRTILEGQGFLYKKMYHLTLMEAEARITETALDIRKTMEK